MIDYEKLRIAYQIARSFKHDIVITSYSYFKNLDHLEDGNKFRLYIDEHDFYFDETYYDIDDLIAKLKELNKKDEPKPKYKVGDKVWYQAHGIIAQDVVMGIYPNAIMELCVKTLKIEYALKNDNIFEANLFSSRGELIESQIEHWTELKNEECLHEPEMNFAKDERPRFEKEHNPKCSKCGEFYK